MSAYLFEGTLLIIDGPSDVLRATSWALRTAEATSALNAGELTLRADFRRAQQQVFTIAERGNDGNDAEIGAATMLDMMTLDEVAAMLPHGPGLRQLRNIARTQLGGRKVGSRWLCDPFEVARFVRERDCGR